MTFIKGEAEVLRLPCKKAKKPGVQAFDTLYDAYSHQICYKISTKNYILIPNNITKTS